MPMIEAFAEKLSWGGVDYVRDFRKYFRAAEESPRSSFLRPGAMGFGICTGAVA